MIFFFPEKRFALRYQFDPPNSKRLHRLPGELYTYYAQDAFGDDNDHWCIAPKTLELKVGAQVILLVNLDDTHVNGSQGIVIGFTEGKIPASETKEKKSDISDT